MNNCIFFPFDANSMDEEKVAAVTDQNLAPYLDGTHRFLTIFSSSLNQTKKKKKTSKEAKKQSDPKIKMKPSGFLLQKCLT